MSMLDIRVRSERIRKPEADVLQEAAEEIAMHCLRDHVTMPADPNDMSVSLTLTASGGRLPPVSCAFRGCGWCGGGPSSRQAYEDDCEHPWDQQLREHVASTHGARLSELTSPLLGNARSSELIWDLYKGALSVQERKQVPCVGPSVDRRVFENTSHVYNDDRIRSLICFACAQVHVDTCLLYTSPSPRDRG